MGGPHKKKLMSSCRNHQSSKYSRLELKPFRGSNPQPLYIDIPPLILFLCVAYFDQCLGDAHSKICIFSIFCAKKLKKCKKQEICSKI